MASTNVSALPQSEIESIRKVFDRGDSNACLSLIAEKGELKATDSKTSELALYYIFHEMPLSLAREVTSLCPHLYPMFGRNIRAQGLYRISKEEKQEVDAVFSSGNVTRCLQLVSEKKRDARGFVLEYFFREIPWPLAKKVLDRDALSIFGRDGYINKSIQPAYKFKMDEITKQVALSSTKNRSREEALVLVRESGANLGLLEDRWKKDPEIVSEAIRNYQEAYFYADDSVQDAPAVLEALFSYITQPQREEIDLVLDKQNGKECEALGEKLFSGLKQEGNAAVWVYFVRKLPASLAQRLVFDRYSRYQWFPRFPKELRSDESVALSAVTHDGNNYAYIGSDTVREKLFGHVVAFFKLNQREFTDPRNFCKLFTSIPENVRRAIPSGCQEQAERIFADLSRELDRGRGDLEGISRPLSSAALSFFPIAFEAITLGNELNKSRDTVFTVEAVRNDRRLMLFAIKFNPIAFSKACNSLQNDLTFIYEALEENAQVYTYLPLQYKQRVEVGQAAVASTGRPPHFRDTQIFELLLPELKEHPDFAELRQRAEEARFGYREPLSKRSKVV
jgi:hypothetical protein